MGNPYIYVIYGKENYMKTTDLAELNTEIERRIEEMEQTGYEFPRRFSKVDYIVTITVAFICLALIVAGAFIG